MTLASCRWCAFDVWFQACNWITEGGGKTSNFLIPLSIHLWNDKAIYFVGNIPYVLCSLARRSCGLDIWFKVIIFFAAEFVYHTWEIKSTDLHLDIHIQNHCLSLSVAGGKLVVCIKRYCSLKPCVGLSIQGYLCIVSNVSNCHSLGVWPADCLCSKLHFSDM
jgi:hypothetical protein